MPDDRRFGSRREDDHALDVVVGRLRDAEDRFERSLQRLDDELDRLRDAIYNRVRELEEFHIEDRTRAREQIADRMRRSQRIATLASISTVLSIALAVIEHFAHI